MIRGRNVVKKLLQGALVALGSTVLVGLIWLFGGLEGFETRTWDWRVRLLAKPTEATEDIALIFLDQNSLDWAQEANSLSWPWPREVYSYIISFCKRAGVKGLIFDVLFTEPSKYGVYDDQALADAMSDIGNIVGTLFLGEETGSAGAWPSDLGKPELSILDLDRWPGQESVRFSRATFPVPELARAARYLANVSSRPDSDGVFRRGALFNLFDNTVIPSPALAAYLLEEGGIDRIQIRKKELAIDRLTVPIDRSGSAIINYRGPSQTHSTYSAAAIIQSEVQLLSGETPTVDPELLADRYVFFGFSAPGLYDLRPSPISEVYPGVEVHATMLDNLLSGDFMRDVSKVNAILLTFLFTALAGLAATFFPGPGKSVAVYALFLPLPPVLSLLAYSWGVWLPLILVELAVVITLVGSGVLNYATEGRQKRYIKSAFKQYLSPTVIEQLIANPDRLKLGGEKRELSIFFSDLQGFTGISEGLSPEELTSLLNDYLTAMTDIIQEEGGTVDKFEGDAIIAFWNAPVDQPDHAVRSVQAALRCQARLAELRPQFKERIGKEMRVRIGINTGPAVVGNMGSHTRFDYTMLGDAVNLAARLEGINKQFGTYTMISRDTVNSLGGTFPVRELSRVAVVGRKEAVTVFEPFLPDDYKNREETHRIFAEGLDLFYRGTFQGASEAFSHIAGQDPPAAAYIRKCRQLSADPPDNWDGVWIMTEK